jgi:hypothetical protein
MQSPLGILALPLFAPVLMHSLGALIRRGSVSRSAFHPAGREEERKERGAQGMAEGHLFPPASLVSCLVYGFLWPGRCTAVLSPCTYFGANQFP